MHRYDNKPKRRLYSLLKSQGLQPNQQVIFISDGGDTVRSVQQYINPYAEHVLDWFHVTMRITVMAQMAKSLRSEEVPDIANQTAKQLERLKWFLWHGNVYKALQVLEDLSWEVEGADDNEPGSKLSRALEDFYGYIHANRDTVPNYGDRYRHGERIASGFVESTINQVVSKRLVKKQQMRWTDRGAHLLLQVRTKTLNDELRPTFEAWYPDMKEAA